MVVRRERVVSLFNGDWLADQMRIMQAHLNELARPKMPLRWEGDDN